MVKFCKRFSRGSLQRNNRNRREGCLCWRCSGILEGLPMLSRVLEPEVMNTQSEAVDYNQMDLIMV